MKVTLNVYIILIMFLLLVGCSSNTRLGEDGMRVLNPIRGEDIASAMLNMEHEQLYNQFSDELKKMVTLKQYVALSQEFMSGEVEFQLSAQTNINDYQSYIWRSSLTDKGIIAVLNNQQIIEGFQVLNLHTYPDTDAMKSEISYQLPFEDEWYVYWGGKDVLTNYHYEYEHMRYAYDFVKTVDGYSYSGDPLINESYFAFNQDVVAPGDGVVIKVVSHIPDNIPGEMNEQHPEGNLVLIEHEHDEYSLLAHFKLDSIVVQEGDKVVAGQLLGKSGNSGNSSEAHIHYQVSKKTENGKEIIIPIMFESGKEWVRGEIATN